MSCARPCALLRGPAFFDASISCSQNPISPEDVVERTGFFINPYILKTENEGNEQKTNIQNILHCLYH